MIPMIESTMMKIDLYSKSYSFRDEIKKVNIDNLQTNSLFRVRLISLYFSGPKCWGNFFDICFKHKHKKPKSYLKVLKENYDILLHCFYDAFLPVLFEPSI